MDDHDDGVFCKEAESLVMTAPSSAVTAVNVKVVMRSMRHRKWRLL